MEAGEEAAVKCRRQGLPTLGMSPTAKLLDPDRVSSTDLWKTLWINHYRATEVSESS
jgi:hypothetical protein